VRNKQVKSSFTLLPAPCPLPYFLGVHEGKRGRGDDINSLNVSEVFEGV
jgi:hypothetical protein